MDLQAQLQRGTWSPPAKEPLASIFKAGWTWLTGITLGIYTHALADHQREAAGAVAVDLELKGE